VFDNPGNRVVGAGVEYPAGSYANYGPDWQIDITDNKLIITWTRAEWVEFQPGAFNGFILDTLGTPITSASVDPARDFYPVELTVNGNRIEANFQSEWVPPGPSSAIISVVPEPSGLALLALAVPALLRRRHLSRERPQEEVTRPPGWGEGRTHELLRRRRAARTIPAARLLNKSFPIAA
jgi:MYXO-CTERM domain-containing protein